MSLPTPIGRQKDVLYLPTQGHFVVLGTAGSGKTTLAVLRAGSRTPVLKITQGVL
jgi:ABC-type taurine transport system ATPase subunit